ncbi:hypothetical protein [Campylobacter hyointestinalis]|uniref:hypothetical protein n=1 Tax=Campylobacter hyointestinalis TaxID=198 RepID=UPI000CE5290C|nr:hypothetical protein [Campylobacter hyointestinalis]PPB54478.1 hypothetical protein CDQ69_03440 [Campylobacter hyointestinalis subsp. hyointestinalis]
MSLKELEFTRKRLKAKLLALIFTSAFAGFILAVLLFVFDVFLALIAGVFTTLYIYYHYKFKITSDFEAGLKERVLAELFDFDKLTLPLDKVEFLQNENDENAIINYYPLFATKFDEFEALFYDVCLKDKITKNRLFYGLFVSSKFKKYIQNELDISNLKETFGCDVTVKISDDKVLVYINQGHDSLALNLKTPLDETGLDITKFKKEINAILELFKRL